jgi:oligopeptide/dipeptide ABC transporter ATP-binding protein
MITHDLGVVAGIADDIAVMYGGKVVERGPTEPVFYDTAHPYTGGLIAAVPTLEGSGALRQIPGTPPSIFNRPAGCSFAPRCERAQALCHSEDPPFVRHGATACACHFPLTPQSRSATS